MPTQVLFDAPYGVYNPGDLAAFPHAEAVRIVNLKHKHQGQELPIAHLPSDREIAAYGEKISAPAPPAMKRYRVVAPNFGPYRPGDIASFTADQARGPLADKAIVPYSPPAQVLLPTAEVKPAPKVAPKDRTAKGAVTK